MGNLKRNFSSHLLKQPELSFSESFGDSADLGGIDRMSV